MVKPKIDYWKMKRLINKKLSNPIRYKRKKLDRSKTRKKIFLSITLRFCKRNMEKFMISLLLWRK